jgi:hypothetical protein
VTNGDKSNDDTMVQMAEVLSASSCVSASSPDQNSQRLGYWYVKKKNITTDP